MLYKCELYETLYIIGLLLPLLYINRIFLKEGKFTRFTQFTFFSLLNSLFKVT